MLSMQTASLSYAFSAPAAPSRASVRMETKEDLQALAVAQNPTVGFWVCNGEGSALAIPLVSVVPRPPPPASHFAARLASHRLVSARASRTSSEAPPRAHVGGSRPLSSTASPAPSRPSRAGSSGAMLAFFYASAFVLLFWAPFVYYHREVHGVLQGKVVTGAPGRCHPIQHVCALVPVFRRTYGEPRALPIHTCGSAHRSQWSFGGISRTVQGPAVSNDGSYTDALPFNHGHEH